MGGQLRMMPPVLRRRGVLRWAAPAGWVRASTQPRSRMWPVRTYFSMMGRRSRMTAENMGVWLGKGGGCQVAVEEKAETGTAATLFKLRRRDFALERLG